MSDDERHSATHSDADSTQIVEQLRHLLARNDGLGSARNPGIGAMRAMMASILSGKAAERHGLSAALGVPQQEMDATIAALVRGGRIEQADDGRIVGAAGLSLDSTEYALLIDGVALHTWCALDAIGIPAALRLDATVTSQCATCRDRVSVTINQGAPTSDVVVSVPTWSCSNPREEFCGRSLFFCSDEHAQQWLATSGPSLILGVRETAEVGQAVWAWTIETA